jgi:Protein of unknown function (DUF3455)
MRSALVTCRRMFSVAALCSLAACVGERPVPPTDVPPALQVPKGHKLTKALHATGVQIYQCTASAQNPPRYGWIHQSPAAELAERSGKEVGRHYDGPTWEGYDGSKVVGDVVARDPGPNPSGGITWLLLRSKSNAGKGIFGKTQSILRLHTIGGLAPTSPCDASHAGQRMRVPYSADYYFYDAPR